MVEVVVSKLITWLIRIIILLLIGISISTFIPRKNEKNERQGEKFK